MSLKKVIAIVGPTAVGKTSLSIKLAQKYNGEVISGDSMQVYRHLDVGTAKITPSEMQDIPHHLINIRDVDQTYTVYQFQQAANELIKQIYNRGKIPFVVGGTGFYINALIKNLNLGGQQDSKQSQKIRKNYELLAQKKGITYLWNELNELDPDAANKIPQNNERRLIRALEVIRRTGKKFSQQEQNKILYDFKVIGLNTDRSLLYQRINQRVDLMNNNGLLPEAKWLYERRATSPQARNGIGYKELFPYFDGTIELDRALELIKRNSRHFAKRQLTYFRNQMKVDWFDLVQHPEQEKQIETEIKNFMEESN